MSSEVVLPGVHPAPPHNSNIVKCDFYGLAGIIGFTPASSLFSDPPENPVIRDRLQSDKPRVCVRMVRATGRLGADHAEVVDAPAGKTGPLSVLFDRE